MNPIQKLMAEHQIIIRGIESLENAAQRLEDGEPVPPGHFHSAVDFIRNYADKYHHAKEEEILFKKMVDVGFSTESGPVAMMLYEHDEGRKFVADMEQAINRFAAGDSSATDDIIANARNYADLLRQHIHKEDMVLYPMALNALGESGINRMQPDFDAVEQMQMGIEAKYLEILATLEAAMV